MKVQSIEIKTASNGNQYKAVTLEEKVKDKDQTNVFNNHALFNDLVVGYEIKDTDLYINQKGYLEIANPDGGVKKNFGGGGKIEKLMDRKDAGIEKNMGRKENGMLLAGSSRDATLITVAQFTGKTFTDEELKAKWLMWRKWLIEIHGNQTDITETKQPF